MLLGIGIGLYFEWKPILSIELALSLSFIFGLLSYFSYRFYQHLFWPLIISCLISIGYTVALIDEQRHDRPQLIETYDHIRVQADVVSIEHSNRGKVRLLLDNVQDQMDLKLNIPDGIRLSMYPSMIPADLKHGDRISVIATLMPIPQPESEGIYDFSFAAYYKGITGIGFAKSRVIIVDPGAQAGFVEALKSLPLPVIVKVLLVLGVVIKGASKVMILFVVSKAVISLVSLVSIIVRIEPTIASAFVILFTVLILEKS